MSSRTNSTATLVPRSTSRSSRRDQGGGRDGEDEDDPVYDQAIELVARMEEVSVSKLQRVSPVPNV